jgi:cytidylate kinase
MYNIAIDGPSGAGKSTIAKDLSKKLNFIYVDTGAMYRAIALYFYENDIDISLEDVVSFHLSNIDIDIKYEDGKQIVLLNGKDVSESIRTEKIGGMASSISVFSEVRSKLLNLQRNLAMKNKVVMDGRDIASHVLPNADLKIYLTASVDTRADRRYKELKEKCLDVNLEEIKKEIETRDYRDINREIAPLRQVEEAILIDSSNLSIEEVVEKIISLVNIER